MGSLSAVTQQSSLFIYNTTALALKTWGINPGMLWIEGAKNVHKIQQDSVIYSL